MPSDDLPFVPTSGLQICYEAIGERSDRCGAHHPGIYERCSNDAAYRTTYRSGRAQFQPVLLCEEHASQFADCDCDGDRLELGVHRADQCVATVDDLDVEGPMETDLEIGDQSDRDFDDYFREA